VESTANFLEKALGYPRKPGPDNSPVKTVWLDIGHGQELHLLYVAGFNVSPFESEFGRHVALFHPLSDFPALRQRILAAGGEFFEQLRTVPFQRFFFREPINGYVFEVVDSARHGQLLTDSLP
jgi:hypothetical protein